MSQRIADVCKRKAGRQGRRRKAEGQRGLAVCSRLQSSAAGDLVEVGEVCLEGRVAATPLVGESVVEAERGWRGLKSRHMQIPCFAYFVQSRHQRSDPATACVCFCTVGLMQSHQISDA